MSLTFAPLTAQSFPFAIRMAIGEETLNNMPERSLDIAVETAVQYSNETGPVKGRDADGRVYIVFSLTNPRYKEIEHEAKILKISRSDHIVKETVFFWIYQNCPTDSLLNVNDRLFFHNLCEDIPTNDQRILDETSAITNAKCEAIYEIFRGVHKDLSVVPPKAEEAPPDYDQSTVFIKSIAD